MVVCNCDCVNPAVELDVVDRGFKSKFNLGIDGMDGIVGMDCNGGNDGSVIPFIDTEGRGGIDGRDDMDGIGGIGMVLIGIWGIDGSDGTDDCFIWLFEDEHELLDCGNIWFLDWGLLLNWGCDLIWPAIGDGLGPVLHWFGKYGILILNCSIFCDCKFM